MENKASCSCIDVPLSLLQDDTRDNNCKDRIPSDS